MQLSLAQFLEVIEDESVLIIDARPISSIMEGYIPNAIHITPATAKYAIAMDIIRKDSPIVFIVEDAIAAETLARPRICQNAKGTVYVVNSLFLVGI